MSPTSFESHSSSHSNQDVANLLGMDLIELKEAEISRLQHLKLFSEMDHRLGLEMLPFK